MKIRQSLPVDAYIADMVAALERSRNLVIRAQPGAGKTTRFPLALLEDERFKSRRIFVVEPRRLAAKVAAGFVASEYECEVGDIVGYHVRFERKASAQTRLLYITEGLILRLIQERPSDFKDAVVVFDEFHERNVQADVGLAMLRSLQNTDVLPDLKLVVMSATLDTSSLAEYLDTSSIFNIEGRSFPLTIEHRPQLGRDISREPIKYVAGLVREMMADRRVSANILVFLAGQRDIQHLFDLLTTSVDQGEWQVMRLYSELKQEEQELVFRKSNRRKVILATNIAETSLTIDGVDGVIDCGEANILGYLPWSGLDVLERKRISQASCIQRAGRAGRQRPGVVFRAYSQQDFDSRDKYPLPEIVRVDLNRLYLEVSYFVAKHLNSDAASFYWFEPPAERKWEQAVELLRQLKAIDEKGNVTSLGGDILRLPLHPRLGALIYRGIEVGCGNDAVLAAALINEGFLLRDGGEELSTGTCDISFQIQLLKDLWRGERVSSLLMQLIDRPRFSAIKKSAQSLAEQVAIALDVNNGVDEDRLKLALLTAYFDRLGKQVRVGKGGSAKADYAFCLGGGGVLSRQSILDDPSFIIAVDARARSAQGHGGAVVIRNASEVDFETIEREQAAYLLRTIEDRYNAKLGKPERYEVTSYLNLAIAERKLTTEVGRSSLVQQLLAMWPEPFSDAEEFAQYHARIAVLKQIGLSDDFPVFEGDMLELLAHEIVEGCQSLHDLKKASLLHFLEQQLSYESQQLLRSAAPLQWIAKGRKPLKIVYPHDGQPFVAGYIQDFYGLKETPTIANGRVSLVCHLLAPNKRVVQVTSNLKEFWTTHYPALRQELGRRYPRHHWADDPLQAPAVLLKSHLNKA